MVFVPFLEHFAQISKIFRFRHKISENRADTRLESRCLGEGGDISAEIQLLLVIQVARHLVILDPRQVEQLFNCRSFILILG